ncbi:MAG: hypothetical protein LBU32_20340 [Clostridiales bacterium]|jgi:TrpR-related protein YerC/YecD|nr:hypothetical protein [Clostridiales bacterium]
MSEDKNNASINRLYKLILQLGGLEECSAFFEDLCTPRELQSLAQRLDVALLLRQGKTYIEINEMIGASSVTISRVSRAMRNGSQGYTQMLERLVAQSRSGETL